MSFFRSIAGAADVMALFKRFPKSVRPLLEYHDVVLRDEDSAFSIAERELIAAYVSSLNNCKYCFNAHRRYAEAFGMDPAIFGEIEIDFGSDVLPARLRPIFAYVRKLTLDPASIEQADADSVFAAGWNDDALYEAISVCALYNFMNRIVEGAGIKTYHDANKFSPTAMRSFRYINIMKIIERPRAP